MIEIEKEKPIKLIKPNKYGKELEKKVIEGAAKRELTTYVKHKKTGAVVPIDSKFVMRMANGESFDIGEAERRYNRRYFKVEKLTDRWDMESDDIVAILMEFEVPCFFNPNEVEHDETTAKVGCNDICVFEEYVLAIEKKRKLKKKNVNSRYMGNHNN